MQVRLAKILGRWDSVAVIISIAVGVGIFRVPAAVAQHLSDPVLILLAWVVGGLISLCGALCYAELASSLPETGGDYIYLRESYGYFVAFLYAWAELTVIRTGSIAAVSFICAEHLQSCLSTSFDTIKLIAVLIVLSISFVNMYGLKYGKTVQDAAMLAKIAGFASVAVFAAWSQGGDVANFRQTSLTLDVGFFQLFGVALIPILWTYGGWHENTFLAGETKDATATVPFALITGCLIIISLYVIMNCIYIYLLPVPAIASAQLIGSDIMELLWGPTGKKLFDAFVVVISIGCINAMIMAGGRVTYAMATDNVLFAYLGHVNAGHSAPYRAVFFNAAWSVALITIGSFNELLFFTGILVWLFFGLVVGGLFILRWRFPNIQRVHRVWGYPFVPAIFAAVCLALCINTFVFYQLQALAGLGLLITGIPIYLLSRRWERQPSSP